LFFWVYVCIYRLLYEQLINHAAHETLYSIFMNLIHITLLLCIKVNVKGTLLGDVQPLNFLRKLSVHAWAPVTTYKAILMILEGTIQPEKNGFESGTSTIVLTLHTIADVILKALLNCKKPAFRAKEGASVSLMHPYQKLSTYALLHGTAHVPISHRCKPGVAINNINVFLRRIPLQTVG
jgi:hypothetical protein